MPEIGQKVYYSDKDKSYMKAKAAKCRRNAVSSEYLDSDLSSSFINFRTEDSSYKEDFLVLPVFVPTNTLDHSKEYGKAAKKSTPGEAVAEMSSTKGLQ